MDFESVSIISDYCQNIFISSSDSNTLLVFLPAVNGKNIYPYYPRQSWGKELSKRYNVLYISDPYQQLPEYKEPMGSWFISPDGVSTLEILAKKIELFMKEILVENVVFYGSSMGGYAAIILSSLISNSKAIAECPQTYLKNHPGSRFVCENILDKEASISNVEPLNYLTNSNGSHINIVCSIFDRHYEQHVLPFLEDVIKIKNINFLLETNLYANPNYNKGHVALQKKEAFEIINKITSFF